MTGRVASGRTKARVASTPKTDTASESVTSTGPPVNQCADIFDFLTGVRSNSPGNHGRDGRMIRKGLADAVVEADADSRIPGIRRMSRGHDLPRGIGDVPHLLKYPPPGTRAITVGPQAAFLAPLIVQKER